MGGRLKVIMPTKPSPTPRRLLHLAHLWLGLILCVPLVLLGLTGTILVFDKDFRPASRATVGTSQPIAAIIAAAAKAAPDHQKPSIYSPPSDENAMASVRFSAGGGQRGGPGGFGAQILVDPVSLQTSMAAPNGFIRQVHMLHGNLLMSGRTGRGIIGWLGVVMVIMGFSGLVIWWPRPGRWVAAFKVGRGAKGVRLHRELHGAVGIWGLIVFITVSVSGVYLGFPETMGGLFGVEANAPPPKVEPVTQTQPLDADGAVAVATAAMPGGTLRSLGLPARPDQPYRVMLMRAGSADGAPATTVFVDPWKAAVIEIRDPAALGIGPRLAAWQHATHAGEGLGPVWHILVGISGLLPAVFAVTGMSMWMMKRRAKARIAEAKTANMMAAE
jgi:uncharacterized iron-regulated membrane protein